MARSLEDLFARFATTGDPQALGEVFDRSSGELLPLAMHLTGHPADAEDALQATFVTAIEKRADWDARRPLLPWLVGILALHGKKLHERRGRRREVPPPDDREALAALAASAPDAPDPEDAPIAASERRELVERLRAHVQSLPDEQRSVVLLQLEHGLRPAQIAEALGVPPGTVRMRLHRGLKALRGLLPPALVAWLAAMLPQRGTAAVRQAVLQHAARTVPVAVAAGVAGVAVAKWFAAAVAFVALVVSFAAWPPATQLPLAVDRPGDSPPAVVADLGAQAPADEVGTRQAAPAASASLSAAADASELRVRVLRPDESPVSGCVVTIEPVRGDVDLTFDAVDAVTPADGVARFAAAPGTIYDVVTATARARVQALATGPTDVELRLQAPASLRRPFGDPSLSAPVRVTGVVRRPDGAPAAGASLCLTRHSVRTTAVPVAVAAADGSFAFETIGIAMLQAQAPGFAASELRPCTASSMTITLQPSRGDLVGIVVDADGQPVAGARVRGVPQRTFRGAGLASAEPRPLAFVATDRAGGFVVPDLPTGRIDVAVQADGHAPATLVVTEATALRVPVRIVLPRGVALRGRVVDQDGAPVAGVIVRLGGSHGVARTTDADGRFGFRSAAATGQALRVEGSTIVPVHVERDLAVDAGEWHVVVQRLVAYPLQLVDATRSPLAGWWASVDGDDFAMPVQADVQGRLTLAAPAARPARVLVHRGLGNRPIPVAWPAESAPGVLGTVVVPDSAPASALLRGRVLAADGAPVDGLTVWAVNAGGRIEAYGDARDGGFEVRNLPAGDYALAVQTADSEAEARFPVAALAVGEARDLGDLRLPAQGTVAVRVVRPGGGAAVEPRLFFQRVGGPAAEDFDRDGPRADGDPHPWPVGRWRWRYLEEAGLWQRGELDVKAGERTTLDLVVPPAVRRKLVFPLPTPPWGAPSRVQFALRGPDGALYDDGSFDPRVELPYRYAPTLAVGRWTLELTTDAGLRFRGEFPVDKLAPSLDEVVIAVQPAR